MDALNVIEGQDERRSFVRLNLLSLSLTLGAIVFLLLAVGAVVAFPLVMSTFGLEGLHRHRHLADPLAAACSR